MSKKGQQQTEATVGFTLGDRQALESKIKSLEQQVDTQARCIEGCTEELERLRKAQPPVHVVRAYESGARAERARVLEQSRVELLSWPTNRGALESFRKALQDERLPLPAYKPLEGV